MRLCYTGKQAAFGLKFPNKRGEQALRKKAAIAAFLSFIFFDGVLMLPKGHVSGTVF